MSRRVRTVLLLVVIALFPARPALAWKLETHIWLASKLVAELQASGCNVTIAPFGSHVVRKDVCDAILQNQGAFLLGVLGADVYPDMVAGQFTTHPGVERSAKAVGFVRTTLQQLGRPTFNEPRLWHTDDWLNHVRKAANSPAEVAFAHGYMIHAAMDMWAHTYVNIYSGGVFSLVDEQEVEFRHMALESFIKHTHKSFPGTGGARPSVGGRTGSDALTPLTAPIAFVRETLVLNADAAQQYAMQEQTLHLWVMYTYWNEVRNLTTRIQPLLNAASQAAKTLDDAIAKSADAFKAAQSAYDVADAAYRNAVKEYNSLVAQFAPTNPAVKTAKAGVDSALAELNRAKATLAPMKLQRDMRTAVGNIERDAQNLAKGPIDQWRKHLERAVDEYLIAWQDTSKEMMRPKPTIITAGSDPTYPLTRWATCWGATFGLPFTSLSAGCSTTLSDYKALNDTLKAWKDSLIKDPLRTHIVNFEKEVNRIGEDLVIQSGVALSSHFNDKGVAAGYTRSLVTLRSKETPTPAALDAQFRGNTSQKNLVKYTQVNFSNLVLADMGVTAMPHDADLADLKNFAALQNSVTMSRLTLLGGAELNGLVARAMKLGVDRRAVAGGTPTMAREGSTPLLYGSSEPTGIVLLGALRSIDGDHQWQRVAPLLPPAVGIVSMEGSVPKELRDRTPSGAGGPINVPGTCRLFGYDASNPGKGGLRLWQNLPARRAVFNQIFLAPLTPGLEKHRTSLKLVLSQGLAGIATSADGAYPPTVSSCPSGR